MNTLKYKLVALCLLITSFAIAQNRVEKLSKTIKVPSDVSVDLNTSHVNIQVDTWNKNEIKVEAFIESDEISKDLLKDMLADWDLEVEKRNNSVEISSSKKGNWLVIDDVDGDYTKALNNLKLSLADLPEMPALPKFPKMPEMVDMPALPALPKLPKGVKNVSFDYEAYKQGGEAYLEEWSQEYEDKYGAEYKEKMKAWAREFSKTDFDKYQKEMEEWGERFGEQFGESWGKEMEEWGEELGKRFEGDWAKQMEEWGEKLGETFGKDIEKWGEQFGEEFGKSMEKWAEELVKNIDTTNLSNNGGNTYIIQDKNKAKLAKERVKRMKAREKARKEALKARLEARKKQLEERTTALKAREKERKRVYTNSRNNQKVKRILKITLPKDADVNVNVRHGKLKFVSTINNLKADLSHTTLVATNINGSDTSINAAYSPVIVDNWNLGELKLRYVNNAQLQTVKNLILDSNSSDISIGSLEDRAVINGSFGELEIGNIGNNFSNLNLILENSDAFIRLPKTDYELLFKGNYSTFNEEKTDKKVVKNYPKNTSTNKTIVVNAKYSHVTMQ